MCDCYTDKCKECGDEIEMHLEDFDTGRDEVEVYCSAHFPADTRDGVIWVCGDRKGGEDRRMVFVRALTDNASEHMSGNHPNCAFTKVFEVPEGLMAVYDGRVCDMAAVR